MVGKNCRRRVQCKTADKAIAHLSARNPQEFVRSRGRCLMLAIVVVPLNLRMARKYQRRLDALDASEKQ
jgi:hypothetical protein